MTNSFRKLFLGLAGATVLAATSTQAQINPGDLGGGDRLNTITTAVPFLMISPDARSGAMGDVGVATSPDAFSIHWNAAKLAFLEEKTGFSASYTPWLRNLVPDINLLYATFNYKLDKLQSFGLALKYFSLGDINFTDMNGTNIGRFNPNEFSIDGAYSRKLSDNFSVGIAMRYIYSNLAGGLDPNMQTTAGTGFAGDISAYYRKDIKLFKVPFEWSWGANISNIGNKIRYTQSGQANFIPANLRLGTGLKYDIDKYNAFSLFLEFNKLLVPTNPIYARDSTGRFIYDNQNNLVVERGENPNDKSVIEGALSSFTDAPDGFKEELREINTSVGAEYLYNKMFAVRAGYFYEHPTKGGRQYVTFGAGVKFNSFQLHLSYLFPTFQLQRSPLENTLRFSLQFDLGAFKSNSNSSTPSGGSTPSQF